MTEANVKCGSNVFKIEGDDPRLEEAFVSQVLDYALLKELRDRKVVDSRVPYLSGKQMGIIHAIEMRCVFAKNDPCWGYSDDAKKTICKCIQGDCPKIRECNPLYSSEYRDLWMQKEEDTKAYGNPNDRTLHPCFYIVDLISDDEMNSYIADPKNEGFEHQIYYDPIPDEVEKKSVEKFKIDPETGRKMIPIGYKWVIWDKASYEGETLETIWGFADEIEEKPHVKRVKAKRIEEKEENETVKQEPVEIPLDLDSVLFDIQKKIVQSVELVKADVSFFNKYINKRIAIILVNPAEKSYVSSMLIQNEIDHSMIKGGTVDLISIEEGMNTDYDLYILSSSFFKDKPILATNNLESLKTIGQFIQLNISDREYFEFINENGNRWCCRNMYGVTHIVVTEDDIRDMENIPNGEYKVSIVEEKNSYGVYSKQAELLGHLNFDFYKCVKELKKQGEIESMPAYIDGISICVNKGNIRVYGMGHMKFVEY